MPSNSFVATANMAIAAGYEVELVDTDSDGILRNQFTHISVTYSGNPEPSGLVGDDAHYVMRGMGNRQQLVSVLSTHAIKPISTGEGGVILTNDKALNDKMRAMVDHGRKMGLQFGFGHNFRMPEMNAALGLSQLQSADDNLETRKTIAAMYNIQLRDLPLIQPQWRDDHCWHLYPIRVDMQKRDNLRQYLFDNNVGTQVNYPSLDGYEHIGNPELSIVANSRQYARESISIPMCAAMTQEDAQYVIDTIKEYFNAQ